MKRLNKKSIFYLAPAILLAAAGFFLWNNPKATSASWWNDGWAYRKALTINGAKVAGNLENFPVLVNLTDPGLASHAQADGDDIVFIDATGQKLKHEIEKYASTTGELVAWVKMPALASSTDLSLYMYYGNAGVGPQSDRGEVWDRNYEGVWHMPNALTASTTDSTSRNRQASAYGNASTTVSGKIDGGFILNGSNDYLDIADKPGSTTAITVETWVKLDALWPDWTEYTIVSNHDHNNQEGYYLYYKNNSNSPNFEFRIYDGATSRSARSSNVALATSTWYHVVGVYDGTNVQIYVNGILGSLALTISSLNYCNDPLHIGQNPFDYHNLDGNIDEVRISKTYRSLAWIKTSYNNQNDPAGFLSASAEETGPGPVGYWSFDEGYGATAHDETANKNDGTITGATWQDESSCLVGKCLYFDGNDYVNLPTVSSLKPSKVTMSAWFKTVATGTTQFILGHQKSLWTSWQINLTNADLLRAQSGTNIANTNGPVTESREKPTSGQWHYISATYDEVILKLYIDGIFISQHNGNNGPIAYQDDEFSHQHTHIGAHVYDSGPTVEYGFRGFLDEIKIYPYARTAEQVKADYAAGLAGVKINNGISAGFGSASDRWMSDGLVGYWKMDESATTSGALDSSGNGNNGAYYGNASSTAGKYGNGTGFSGGLGYINCGEQSSLDIRDTITVSFWIKGNSSQINSYGPIMHKIDTYGWLASVSGTGPNIFLRVDTSGGINQSDGTIAALDGTWHYIVWSLNNGVRNGYKDGVLIFSNMYNHGNGFRALDKDFIINNPFSDGFNGNLDEVRIYNRALSADEVGKLYEYAPGPVAHWQLDELNGNTAYDISGYSNNGTIGDGVAAYRPAWFNLGKYGSALNFDGDNDYLSVAHKQYFALPPFTAEAWIKFDEIPSVSGKYENFLIKKNSSVPYDSWMVYGDNYPSNQDHITFGIVDNSETGHYITSDTTVSAGIWYHVVAMLDSSYNMNLYINGIKQSGVANSGSIHSSDSDFYIGAQYSGGAQFDGLIDEVKFYNYIRTQKQILEDMSAGVPGLHPVLDLKFNEGKGGTAHDATIYGNNGTLYPGTGGTNTATSAMWTMDGKFGKAIEFDGTDDYVLVTNSNALDNIETNNQFSVSAWINTNAINGSQPTQMIVENGTDSDWNFYMQVPFNSPNIRCSLVHSTGGDHMHSLDSNNLLQAGLWVNAVCSYDGEKMTLYINGEESSSINLGAAHTLRDTELPLRIGDKYTISNTEFFNGKIDEVKIYPYALSKDEIKQDYNQNKTAVMGQTGNSNSTATSSGAAGLEYCVPGSTDYCAAPVGEWKMDENISGNLKTLYDTSGNGYNGTTHYGANETGMDCTQLGKIGTGCNFDGVDDYAQVPAFSHQNIFTASFWIKFNRLPSSYVYNPIFVAKKHNAPPWEVWNFSANNSTNKISFGAYDVAGSGTWINSDAGVSIGVWYYIVGTMDGSYNMNLYINGVKQVATGNTGSLNSSDGVLNLGATALGGAFTNGVIDNVRIYNYVRTPSQIAYEYNRGKPVGYWKFDECSGGVIHDSSGNGYTGTLSLGASDVTAPGTCASSSNSFWYNGRTGKKNSSGSFDGVDDYVNTVDSPFDFTGNFTISAWINPALINSTMQAIACKAESSSFCLELGGPLVNKIDFSVHDGTANRIAIANNQAVQNTWYHVVGLVNGTAVRLYINGVLQSTQGTLSGAPTTNNYNFLIGANPGATPAWYFSGQIDEVKIFNYALTPLQVQTEYNNGAVRFGN